VHVNGLKIVNFFVRVEGPRMTFCQSALFKSIVVKNVIP
jgi:hypothetical protein